MQTTIDKCIADLLYDHDKVIVPGLGTFFLTHKSADIDPVQGKMYPPTKAIAFDSQVAADDGLFVESLCDRTGKTLIESRQDLQLYVEQQKARLHKKEIVIIDKVGRLYIDFEEKLQFLPDTTNFNTDSFGLPSVTALPITKPETTPPKTTAGTTLADNDHLSAKKKGSFIQRNMGLIIGLAIFLVIAIIFALVYKRFILDHQNKPTANLPAYPTSPAQENDNNEIAMDDPALDFPPEESDYTTNDEMQNEAEENPMDEESPSNLENDDYDDSLTEAITRPPNEKSAIIGIGVFSNQENVNKLVERIYKAGYEPYLKEQNGRTRVGIQLSYTNQADVQTALRVARDEFASDAFIMKQ